MRRSEKVEHCGVGAGFGLRAQGAGVVGSTLLHMDRREHGLRCAVMVAAGQAGTGGGVQGAARRGSLQMRKVREAGWAACVHVMRRLGRDRGAWLSGQGVRVNRSYF